jgi:hypothetical protein
VPLACGFDRSIRLWACLQATTALPVLEDHTREGLAQVEQLRVQFGQFGKNLVVGTTELFEQARSLFSHSRRTPSVTRDVFFWVCVCVGGGCFRRSVPATDFPCGGECMMPCFEGTSCC